MSLRIEKLRMESMIGYGTFGYVFFGHTEDNCPVAWKRVLKTSDRLPRELETLEKVKGCRHVVQLLAFFYSVNYRNDVVQNFIFKYYSSSLEHLLKLQDARTIDLSYLTVKKMMYQVALGLNELHSLGICHRDLKPENVLIKDSQLVISDLGSAKKLSDFNTPYVVSRYYRAPELILGVEDYDFSIDIWAFGVMFFEFLMKKLPFKGKSEGQQLIEIYRALGPPNEEEKVFLKKRMGKDLRDSDVLFGIEQRRNIYDELDRLRLPKKERSNLESFFRAVFEYNFLKRPSVRKLMKFELWRDVEGCYDEFEIRV